MPANLLIILQLQCDRRSGSQQDKRGKAPNKNHPAYTASPSLSSDVDVAKHSVFWAGVREGFGFQDLSAFLNHVEAVNGEVGQCIDISGRPANLDQVNFLGVAEAEMYAQVAG